MRWPSPPSESRSSPYSAVGVGAWDVPLALVPLVPVPSAPPPS